MKGSAAMQMPKIKLSIAKPKVMRTRTAKIGNVKIAKLHLKEPKISSGFRSALMRRVGA